MGGEGGRAFLVILPVNTLLIYIKQCGGSVSPASPPVLGAGWEVGMAFIVILLIYIRQYVYKIDMTWFEILVLFLLSTQTRTVVQLP